MALPDNFSPFEHLQDMLRNSHNKRVLKYFSDVGDASWEPSLATVRGQMRIASTMRDDDTATMMLMRLYLFYDVFGYGRKNLAILYGDSDKLPTDSVDGKPKIFLYFSQDENKVNPDEKRIEAEISFRIMDETNESITPSKMMVYANRIKTEFIEARKGIVFTKGKNIYSYRDKLRGYQLGIYANEELEATEIIKKCLRVQNISFDDDYLSVSTPKKNNASVTGTVRVYGKTVKKKRFRPIGDVRFRYAYCDLGRLIKPVFLVDTTYRQTALVYP